MALTLEFAPSVAIPVRENTDVAAARRAALRLSENAGLDSGKANDAGIVVTELATNILKHGDGGEILLRREKSHIEILAIDRGRGMGDAERCFSDGYSTAGSPGNGLGAIRRLATFCDFYSRPDVGTIALAHLGGTNPHGVINAPYPGEDICGDAFVIHENHERLRVFLADGLGHGVHASEASQAAVALTSEQNNRTPANLIEAAHLRLRSTRGAAGSVADIEADGSNVEFCGVGNVVGIVVDVANTRRQMVSSNGTLGHEFRRAHQFRYPAQKNGLVILHSDGLSAGWSLAKYPGLFQRHPGTIAAVLYRDFRRTRDDATVVVVRVK